MITPNKIIIHESRPIERRGKKLARPLIESELSIREEIFSSLLPLATNTNYDSTTNPHYRERITTTNISEQISSLIKSSAHIKRQLEFFRKNK